MWWFWGAGWDNVGDVMALGSGVRSGGMWEWEFQE